MATAPKKAARKPRATVDPNETKAGKFTRLCGARVSKALVMVKNIGNCSNKSQYDYTPEQVEAMKKALTDAVSATMARFESAPSADKPTAFTF